MFNEDAIGQQTNLTLDKAIQWALENNKDLKSYELKTEQAKSLIPTAVNIEKTSFYFNYDEVNIGLNDMQVNTYGVSQSFEFPSVYALQKKINSQQYYLEEINYQIKKRDLLKDVSQRYYSIVFLQNRAKLVIYLDSLYKNFANAANRRYELGETTNLEKLTAQAKHNKLNTLMKQVNDNMIAAYQALKEVLQVDSSFVIEEDELKPVVLLNELNLESVPGKLYYDKALQMTDIKISLDRNRFLPDLQLEYYLATNRGPQPNFYNALYYWSCCPALVWATQSQSTLFKNSTGNY